MRGETERTKEPLHGSLRGPRTSFYTLEGYWNSKGGKHLCSNPLGAACLVKETFLPFLRLRELWESIFQSKRSLKYKKTGMCQNESCHQLVYFQEISRTFEINPPAGNLPHQFRGGESGHWNGYELVGMLKNNIIMLTLSKLLKTTIL